MTSTDPPYQNSVTVTRGGVLASRLLDIDPAVFAREYWSQQPHLSRDRRVADLFSAAAVDELVSQRGLRTPFLRVAKQGGTLADRQFTAPGGVGADIADQVDDTALWRQFADGATVVLQALHRTWPPIAELTADLSTELGHPVQANAYVTPPQNRGFDDHYDVHDVFVLQIEGTKRWVIHAPVHPDPLRDEPWTTHRDAVTEAAATTPVLDTLLEPGDVLYLPRGWLHAAQAQGAVSIHLTLGVHVWTRYAVAEQLVRAALDALRADAAMRATLPLGLTGPTDDLDDIRQQLSRALATADPQPEFERVRRAQGRPAPLAPLAQLATLDQLTGTTSLRLRPALEAQLIGSRLMTRVGWLDFASAELTAITRLLEVGTQRADELGLPIARRLLRAGVVVPAAPT